MASEAVSGIRHLVLSTAKSLVTRLAVAKVDSRVENVAQVGVMTRNKTSDGELRQRGPN